MVISCLVTEGKLRYYAFFSVVDYSCLSVALHLLCNFNLRVSVNIQHEGSCLFDHDDDMAAPYPLQPEANLADTHRYSLNHL